MTNIFTSKANVLKFLEKKVKNANIEKILYFTVEDWKNNNKSILQEINKKFQKKNIIIRSSAIGEDSINNSQAGNYKSIQNIRSDSSIDVKQSINKVIKSYEQKNNKNIKNQILIQTHTKNIKKSGVVFTRSLPNGAPYYTINFETGETTDGVTSGKIGNQIKIFRNISKKKIPIKWKKLISAIKEIEEIIKSDLLDIEFGITNNKIIIFQVRPLVSIQKINYKLIDKYILNEIKKSKKKFIEYNKKTDDRIVFSDMSDWNPAEIIGNQPNLLDYSLYNFIIMKDSWAKGRTAIGYQNMNKHQLMVKFGNKPYVDVKASFNSLIPKNVSNQLKKKLVKFYIEKLEKNPYLHDKVEFDILFTCYDLNIKYRFKELLKNKFTKIEINQLQNDLIQFTNEIINNFPNILEKHNEIIGKLSEKRVNILSNLQNNDIQKLQNTVKILLKDCKKFGGIPFVTMARIGFIGNIILKSLDQNKNNFNTEKFMKSIETPLTQIQMDIEKYSKNKITTQEFLKKYGHLRPGTYDITVPRYDENQDFFINAQYSKILKKNKDFKIPIIKKLEELSFEKIDFLNFVKISLREREILKFEFTKNLSEAIKGIEKIGKLLGFTKNEMANLDINKIIGKKYKNHNDMKKDWFKLINQEQKRKNYLKYFILPPLIFSEKNFDVIEYYISKPNFITLKKIKAQIIKLESNKKPKRLLKNKIVLIENADPGFDWIFTEKPAGLITKYGGVASHMAIRCAEMNLPAAIGCGEILYEKLKKSLKINLDCKNNEVLILEYFTEDEEIETRNTLKSLGYIR